MELLRKGEKINGVVYTNYKKCNGIYMCGEYDHYTDPCDQFCTMVGY